MLGLQKYSEERLQDKIDNENPNSKKDGIPYIRVGTDFFKIIIKPNRYGVKQLRLKRWTKDLLIFDHGQSFVRSIPQYDEFIVSPDNKKENRILDNCYNMYSKFSHQSKAPPPDDKHKGIYWSFVLMREVFGSQIKMGFQYMQALYLYPRKPLPILSIVSETRGTGKTTYLNWINMIFGANVANIEPDSITRQFNAEYAYSNIVCIDEAVNDRAIAVEKIKSIATKKSILVSMKYVNPFELDFFGKIIMASNNEKRFIRIDAKEIRFWVRKLNKYRIKNHAIEDELIKEIPYFLHYLEQMPPLSWEHSRMLFTPEQLITNSLNLAKAEGKSTLHKDIEIQVDAWFDSNAQADYLEMTSSDIKNYWFKNNSRVSVSYIKQVLIDEMKITPPKKVKRYSDVHGNSHTGRAYRFYNPDKENIYKDEYDQTLPF